MQPGLGWSHGGRRALLAALIESQFRAYSPTHTLDRVLGLPQRRSYLSSQGQVN
jgi:hypothetical protein